MFFFHAIHTLKRKKKETFKSSICFIIELFHLRFLWIMFRYLSFLKKIISFLMLFVLAFLSELFVCFYVQSFEKKISFTKNKEKQSKMKKKCVHITKKKCRSLVTHELIKSLFRLLYIIGQVNDRSNKHQGSFVECGHARAHTYTHEWVRKAKGPTQIWPNSSFFFKLSLFKPKPFPHTPTRERDGERSSEWSNIPKLRADLP